MSSAWPDSLLLIHGNGQRQALFSGKISLCRQRQFPCRPRRAGAANTGVPTFIAIEPLLLFTLDRSPVREQPLEHLLEIEKVAGEAISAA